MRSDFNIEVVGQNENDIKKAHEAIDRARKDAAIERKKAYHNGQNFYQKKKEIFVGTMIVSTEADGEKIVPDGVTIKYGPK